MKNAILTFIFYTASLAVLGATQATKEYVDTKDAATLASGKTYTDTKIADTVAAAALMTNDATIVRASVWQMWTDPLGRPSRDIGVRFAQYAHGLTTLINWGLVSETPTTLSGYGITDAYTQSETDSRITTATNAAMEQANAKFAKIGDIQPSVTDAHIGEIATNVVRYTNGGVWDATLQVLWTPVMANGKLTYQATTNVNLQAGN